MDVLHQLYEVCLHQHETKVGSSGGFAELVLFNVSLILTNVSRPQSIPAPGSSAVEPTGVLL